MSICREDPTEAHTLLATAGSLQQVLNRPPVRSALIVLLLASGAAVAGCTDTSDKIQSTLPRATLTTVTTSAQTTTVTTSRGPNTLANCQSGSASLEVSPSTPPPSVCLRTGSILTVMFRESAGEGVPGPWTIPRLYVTEPSVLKLTLSSQKRPSPYGCT